MRLLIRVAFFVALALLVLAAPALAAPDASSIVSSDADVRAIVGTVVIGIAGGIVLALLDGTATDSRR